ncbi:MAG: molecular chaperone DnaJ [Oligoflexales bacterium]|nr:molecular chaperone DnaJ [Oligoflexales bacterium]
MSKRDYYELLSVSKTVSTDELKISYRKAAMKYHPDRNQGDNSAEEMFKAVSEAYEVLSDPQKRQIYDKFGHEGLSGQGYHGPQGMEDIFSSFGSIFEEFFGFGSTDPRKGRGGRRGRDGSDLRYDLKISFLDAVFGVQKEISFSKGVSCQTCKGNGMKPGTKPLTCSACGGHGQVRKNQGFFSVAMTCSQCNGQGAVIKDPCKTCQGKGQTQEKKNLTVKVPAGVDTGLRLRVTGEGETGEQGGAAGDLYVFLHVEGSSEFVRDGSDVIVTQKIGLAQAALGCQMKVKTLEDEKVITIPPGSHHGQRILLAGQGVPHIRGLARGDFYIELEIQVPQKLSKEQRELLEAYAKASGEEVEASKGSGFFHRIFES